MRVIAAIALASVALTSCAGPAPPAGPPRGGGSATAGANAPAAGTPATTPSASASAAPTGPTKPPSPVAKGADGDWRGTTSQRQRFELIVSDGRVASFTLGFTSPSCAVVSPLRITYPHPTHVVGLGAFSFADNATYPFSVTGRLGPGETAAGSATIDLSFCDDSTVHVTWSATRQG